MNPIRVNVHTIHQDPANANKHSERSINAIAASLREHGQQKPIVIDQTNTIIAGNGQHAAAKLLGWDSMWAVVSDLEGSKKLSYALADNMTATHAVWDKDVLAGHLEGLVKDSDYDWTTPIVEFGFTLDDCLSPAHQPEPPEPSEPKPTCTECGQVLK